MSHGSANCFLFLPLNDILGAIRYITEFVICPMSCPIFFVFAAKRHAGGQLEIILSS